MKVLHINWSGDLGGAENLSYELAKRNNATIAYMSKSSVLGRIAKNEGLNVVEFNMRNGFDLFNLKKYLNFIKKENFAVIHDHNGPPIIRISKIFSPHSLFIQHLHGPKIHPNKWEKLSVRIWKCLTSFLVDHYIANSNYTKIMAMKKEKIRKNLISVIYNGIDIDKFSIKRNSMLRRKFNIADNEFLVGTVCSLTLPKGVDKFILVAEKLNNFADIKFMIVGAGELEGELKALTKNKGLENKVIFAGRVENIIDAYSVFDVFLLTSNWESFGLVLLEAMSLGVPVIAFKVGGVSEVIPKSFGILIPSNIEEAAKSILFIKNNPEKAKKIVECCKDWVKNFTIEKTAKEIKNIYYTLKNKRLQRNKL